jgi:enterochelin esterase family protein
VKKKTKQQITLSNMRKKLFLLSLLFCGMTAGTQEFTVPSTNINAKGWPHILPDNSVEFKIRSNEDLSQMKLSLDQSCRFEKQTDGTWMAHTKPLVPGFHYYWFSLGGMDVSDPASKSYFGCGRMTSAIDIPEAGCSFYDIKDVPHGKVSIVTYYSKVRNANATMYVYTPASYSKGNKRYPVLYLQHGGGEDESGWTLQGKTNYILDNLIAEGKAKDMIVVMSNGNITVPGTGFGYSIQGMKGFEEELTKVIIPFVDQSFRTIADKQHRALSGLSMGGGQSFFVGLQHTELFSYIGVFSTGVFGGIRETKSFDAEAAMPGLISQHDKYNKALKLFYISVGTDDPRLSSTQKAVSDMRQAGLAITFNSFPGDHEWQVWRKSLHDFAQKLFD